MDEAVRQQLLEKNGKIIQMVIERAKRDFPDDIAIIGLCGSFSTGDYHEKSDLDLLIINDTNRGAGISSCFILDDVGYDIYCTPWSPRIEAQSNLESPMVTHLIDMKILYCAKPEYLERFERYRRKALDALAIPMGKEVLARANRNIEKAKRHYADTLLSNEPGAVRLAAGALLSEALTALTHLNGTYLKRGIKRFQEEVYAYPRLPENFREDYEALIAAGGVEEMRDVSLRLLQNLIRLYEKTRDAYASKPVPSRDNLAGTYEELWCNYRNKILASVRTQDISYAYFAALGAQEYLDEMHDMLGTPKWDLLQYFDARNLSLLEERFLRVMDEYLEEYHKAGRSVKRYQTFDQLYRDYMGSSGGAD